jgi:hypothetical protein
MHGLINHVLWFVRILLDMLLRERRSSRTRAKLQEDRNKEVCMDSDVAVVIVVVFSINSTDRVNFYGRRCNDGNLTGSMSLNITTCHPLSSRYTGSDTL